MTDHLSERERIWIVLSDLFLDTDVTPFLDKIERELIVSSFDIKEIDTILLDEVYPVCIANLYDVAGAWAGFEADWLLRRIHKSLAKGLILSRFFKFGRGLRQRQLHAMVPEWRDLRVRVVKGKGET